MKDDREQIETNNGSAGGIAHNPTDVDVMFILCKKSREREGRGGQGESRPFWRLPLGLLFQSFHIGFNQFVARFFLRNSLFRALLLAFPSDGNG